MNVEETVLGGPQDSEPPFLLIHKQEVTKQEVMWITGLQLRLFTLTVVSNWMEALQGLSCGCCHLLEELHGLLNV